MIQFQVLVKPLSQNQVYRRRKTFGMFMTDEGKSFKEHIAWNAKIAMEGKEMLLNPSVTITLYFDNNRRNDLDGPIKLILDSLNNIVYKDDKDVLELHVYKKFDTNARIEIQIEEI